VNRDNASDRGRDKDQRGPSPDNLSEKDRTDEQPGKGHGPLKGTDTPATIDAEYAEREKGKRTTM
jgi:hypothetical protein